MSEQPLKPLNYATPRKGNVVTFRKVVGVLIGAVLLVYFFIIALVCVGILIRFFRT